LKCRSFLDHNYTIGQNLSFHTFMLQGAHIIVCVCVTHTLVIENGNVWYHNTDTTFALSYALCSTSCSLTVLRDMSTFAKKSKYHGKVMASNYNTVL